MSLLFLSCLFASRQDVVNTPEFFTPLPSLFAQRFTKVLVRFNRNSIGFETIQALVLDLGSPTCWETGPEEGK